MNYKSVMLQLAFTAMIALIASGAHAKSELATASSLAMKKGKQQIKRVYAADGDLYKKLLHHGPAVENPWAAYRIYFNDTLSVDILSKFQKRLELAEGQWYGGGRQPELAARNFGKDNYKVGKTVGLGGVRLWDANQQKVITLAVSPQGGREAQVFTNNKTSSISMRNLNVPYQGEWVNIDITLTVFANKRHAQVELAAEEGKLVQFATGLTTHDKLLAIKKGKDHLVTWGDYDSPAASESFNVGGGLVFNSQDIERRITEKEQTLVVSKPLNRFTYLITTSNQKEDSALNNFDGFYQYVKGLVQKLQAE